ncbi:MAG: hypothetical protein N2109_01580 [Fimbriimonadales bacterium]|nr:hypothetical protein [Fimbriimonadales bacterium]
MKSSSLPSGVAANAVVLDCRIIRYTGSNLEEFPPEFLELLKAQREEGYSLASIRWDGDRPELVFQRV